MVSKIGGFGRQLHVGHSSGSGCRPDVEALPCCLLLLLFCFGLFFSRRIRSSQRLQPLPLKPQSAAADWNINHVEASGRTRGPTWLRVPIKDRSLNILLMEVLNSPTH